MKKLILFSFFLALFIPHVRAQVGTLWGTAPAGGSANQGVLFKLNADGSNYTIKQDFNNTTSLGNFPHGLMQASNGKFYGVTDMGGTSDMGTIFEYDPATEVFTRKYSFGPTAATTGSNPKGLLVEAPNGNLYGVTYNGGSYSRGVIFVFQPSTGLTYVANEFSGNSTGTYPMAGMILASNGKMYGMTSKGGSTNNGMLYEFDPASNGFAPRASLTAATGHTPYGVLTEVNGKLYGLTSDGGGFSYGTLVEYNPTSQALTTKLQFGGSIQGKYSRSGLTLAANGKLYGMTSKGGITSGDDGVLFEYDPATNAYTARYEFVAATSGSTPYGTLGLAPDGTMYGMTSVGGASNKGVFFQYDPVSNTFTKKFDFTGTNGATPYIANNVLALRNAQTLTFSSLNPVSYGDAPFTLHASASTALPVTYKSLNTDVATVSGNTVTIVGGGTATIRAVQPGNSTYLPSPSVDQQLTVNKINQTITFPSIPAKTFGPSFTLNATSSSGLAVTYISTNTAVATVSGNTVTMVGLGNTTIRASQAGNANYNAATNVDQALVVSKGDQTITFPAIPVKTMGSGTFALSATASSGLAITYTSSNTSVATISGSTVTLVSAGTTTITASQAGNVNYNAAASESQTLTINKANQTITFGALATKSYGNAPFSVVATSSASLPVSYSSSNTAVATISGNTVTIVGAGTSVITASQAGNATYVAADASQTLTVNKVDQTINFTSLTARTYGTTPFTLSAVASSGLPVTFVSSDPNVISISGSTATVVNAGTATITAVQAGNNNYNAAPSTTQTQTVNKAPQSITFNALPGKYYGDAPFTVTATASSGLPVTFSSNDGTVAKVTGNTVTIVGGGAAMIIASQAGDDNYSAAPNLSQLLSVYKVAQTITFPTLANVAYGVDPMVLTGTASSGLDVTYTSSNTAVATVSGNTLTIRGAGNTNITASQSGNSGYNAASSVTRTLTVTKGNQSITFAALPDKVIGSPAFSLTGTASSQLPVTYASSSNAVATISGSTVTIVGTGTCIITASQAGNGNYNAAANVTQSLTVNKVSQTITFAALPAKTINDAAFALAASASSGLAVTYGSSNTGVATVSGNTVTIRGIGTTTITATQAGNATYGAAPDVTQTLVVNERNKTAQTIAFASLPAKTYGDTSFDLSATATSSLPVSYASSNTSVATVSGSKVTIAGAGTTVITASQAGNDTYGAAGNIEQVLTVNKANQVITFSPLPDKIIGSGPFTLTATSSSGLPVTYVSSNTSVASVQGGEVTVIALGTTTITASQSGNANFNAAADVQQNLLVKEKVPQTITFASLPAKSYGDLPFSLTASASSGLSVAYASSNPSVATISGNTVTITGVGTTLITATQPGNDSYSSAASVEQQLTVAKGNQTITFTTLPVKTIGSSAFTLSASASSGLAILYTSSNTAVATVQGNEVTIVGLGVTTITASQSGDANYNAATSVEQTLTISEKSSQAISFTAPAAKTFGDAPFTLTATSSSGLPVSYSSSNTSVATISGNTVTIVAAGTTTLTARQNGSETFLPADDVARVLTVNKSTQTIVFANVEDKTIGDAAFNLSASASSGLGVVLSTSSDKITLTGNQVALVKAGRVSVSAAQAGNGNYQAAVSVERSFCIKPSKPSITVSDANTATPILTSSATAGNQWYLNGTLIAGSTAASLQATQPGVYKVQVLADDCASEFAEKTLIVTGDIGKVTSTSIDVYPNPASDELTISFGNEDGRREVALYSMTGVLTSVHESAGKEMKIRVADYGAGVYLIRVKSGSSVSFARFIKQ